MKDQVKELTNGHMKELAKVMAMKEYCQEGYTVPEEQRLRLAKAALPTATILTLALALGRATMLAWTPALALALLPAALLAKVFVTTKTLVRRLYLKYSMLMVTSPDKAQPQP